mmetsp:Transcript_3155/g.6528  ORF Transcript_3155/g.6528 Transcript_3155/m.6528 type:complete len:254 (-) Transcript_3155:41-802(-)
MRHPKPIIRWAQSSIIAIQMDKGLDQVIGKLTRLRKDIIKVRQTNRAGQTQESHMTLQSLKKEIAETEILLSNCPKGNSQMYKLRKDFEKLKTCLEQTEETLVAEKESEVQVTEELLAAEAYNDEEEKLKVYSEYKRDLTSINEMMKDLSLTVEAAQPMLDVAESHVDLAENQTAKATVELKGAAKLQSSRLGWMIGGSLSVVGGTIGILGGPVGIGLGAALGGYIGKSLGNKIETYEKQRLEELVPEDRPQE